MNAVKKTFVGKPEQTLSREEFSRITEAFFKKAHDGFSDEQLEHVVEAKTSAYAKALGESDAAKSVLNELAASMDSNDKEVIAASIRQIDRLTMFNGDASMNLNSQWEPFAIDA